MKKLIFLIALYACPLSVDPAGLAAQSSAEVRATVKEQGEAIALLSEVQDDVLTKNDSLVETVKQLADIVKLVVENKEAISQPVKSQEDADLLYGILFGILNLLVNGLSLGFAPFRAFVEKYASKSVLAVATGVIFAVVATVTSKGDSNVLQLLGYLVSILGTHFGSYTALRKQPQTAQG